MSRVPKASWRPQASLTALRQRAQLLAQIRTFFAERAVLEVETPLWAPHTVTDPHLDSVAVQAGGYLQTSPEYAMKRLLAAGLGDCYQLSKAFRQGEAGRWHAPEFTLLEWYRLGFNQRQLATEVCALITQCCPTYSVTYVHYAEAFSGVLGFCPLTATDQALQVACAQHGLVPNTANALQCADYLDILFSQVVCPTFPNQQVTAVLYYPAAQAALARLAPDQPGCAARFEVYIGALELANGYHELCDPEVFLQRSHANQTVRLSQHKALLEVDPYCLAAMQAGLPDCAGVALGVDRLMACTGGYSSLAEVMF